MCGCIAAGDNIATSCPIHSVQPHKKVRISKLMVLAGLASTPAEALRLICQEAVSLNDHKVLDIRADVDLTQTGTIDLKVGTRRSLKIVL